MAPVTKGRPFFPPVGGSVLKSVICCCPESTPEGQAPRCQGLGSRTGWGQGPRAAACRCPGRCGAAACRCPSRCGARGEGEPLESRPVMGQAAEAWAQGARGHRRPFLPQVFGQKQSHLGTFKIQSMLLYLKVRQEESQAMDVTVKPCSQSEGPLTVTPDVAGPCVILGHQHLPCLPPNPHLVPRCSLFQSFPSRCMEIPESKGSPSPTTAQPCRHPEEWPHLPSSLTHSVCPSFHGNSQLSGQEGGTRLFKIMTVGKLSWVCASCYGGFHGNPSHRHTEWRGARCPQHKGALGRWPHDSPPRGCLPLP